MSAPLSLRGSKPLARGSRRLVFQHPFEPGLLVKVLKSRSKRSSSLRVRWMRMLRANEAGGSFRREIGEYLRVRSRIGGLAPIAQVIGIVDTDLGKGLVVEKIASHDGRLAPSLRERVAAQGFDRRLEEQIVGLRDSVIRIGIVAGDLNTRNIVLGDDGRGGERLVIVDGTGDKTFLPINSLIPHINRQSHYRQFAGLMARLKELDSLRSSGS